MDRNVQRLEVLNGGSAYGVDTHKVLRNTYWLLALSLLPTVGGAWLGMTTGFLSAMSPGMSTLLFFVGAYGLMFGVNATKNSSTGVFMLLGFTFFMGLMLSRLLGVVLHGYTNGASLIMTSFAGTAGVIRGRPAAQTTRPLQRPLPDVLALTISAYYLASQDVISKKTILLQSRRENNRKIRNPEMTCHKQFLIPSINWTASSPAICRSW